MTTRPEHITAFLQRELGACEQFPLAGDASFRRYIRIRQGEASFMLMDAPPDKETLAPFIHVCGLLADAGFSVPRILAADKPQGFLLLEDLGDDTFSRLLKVDAREEEIYYQAAVEVLAAWHTGDFAVDGTALPVYDAALLTREATLFSNWFLPQILDGAALADAQAGYMNLWGALLNEIPLATNQFVHRDYHADNSMWLPARSGVQRVGLLDFQDAVMGDAAYDLVSLLEDARRDVSPELARRMVAHYLRHTGASATQFSMAYALLAAQRNSKIIGIFTRLAARDGKAHYLDYLPRVWRHLEQDITHPELASLKAWLDRHVPEGARGVLTIRKDARMLGLAA